MSALGLPARSKSVDPVENPDILGPHSKPVDPVENPDIPEVVGLQDLATVGGVSKSETTSKGLAPLEGMPRDSTANRRLARRGPANGQT